MTQGRDVFFSPTDERVFSEIVKAKFPGFIFFETNPLMEGRFIELDSIDKSEDIMVDGAWPRPGWKPGFRKSDHGSHRVLIKDFEFFLIILRCRSRVREKKCFSDQPVTFLEQGYVTVAYHPPATKKEMSYVGKIRRLVDKAIDQEAKRSLRPFNIDTGQELKNPSWDIPIFAGCDAMRWLRQSESHYFYDSGVFCYRP